MTSSNDYYYQIKQVYVTFKNMKTKELCERLFSGTGNIDSNEYFRKVSDNKWIPFVSDEDRKLWAETMHNQPLISFRGDAKKKNDINKIFKTIMFKR